MPAKVKKKRTRRERRIKEANTKVSLCVIPALIQGFLQDTENNLTIGHKKHLKQLERLHRWSRECINMLYLGKNSVDAASNIIYSVDRQIKKYVVPGERTTVGHYVAVWLMLSYLADEARLYVSRENIRPWNYLSSVTATWVSMFMECAPDDRDYEEAAGKLAEDARRVVFGKPRDHFVKI